MSHVAPTSGVNPPFEAALSPTLFPSFTEPIFSLPVDWKKYASAPNVVTGAKRFSAEAKLVESVPLETEGLKTPGVPLTQEEWIRLIDGATHTIDLEQFYITQKEGEALDPVLAAISRAIARGVRVRAVIANTLMKDPVKNRENIASLEKLKALGVAVRMIDLGPVSGGIVHAKYWIIDDKTIFVGSQNFDWRSLDHIFEVGILTNDPAEVAKAQCVFNLDWKIAETGQKPTAEMLACPTDEKEDDPTITFVASPPGLLPDGVPIEKEQLLKAIGGAKKRIRINLHSFSPLEFYTPDKKPHYWEEFQKVLWEAAVIRKIPVQLMVSESNIRAPQDQPISPHWAFLKSLAQIPGIEVRVVFIPDHSSGIIYYARVDHAKFATIDEEWFWVSSSNGTEGYFENTRDVAVVGTRPETTKTLDNMFDALWTSSYTKDINTFPPPLNLRPQSKFR